MAKTTAFIDTMLFLHFRQIDEVDWCEVLGAPEVELALAPVVIRQLDRHKDGQRNPGLRDRARTSVAKLRSIMGQGGRVRDGVTALFIHTDPLIDFEQRGLSPRVEDDQLIASMIQFSEANPSARVVLVSDDFLLMAAKARAKGFEAVEAPESARLHDPASEDQRRITKLEAENRRLTTRVPKLELAFASEARSGEFVLRPPWTEAERERRIEAVRAKYPPMEAPLPGDLSDVVPVSEIRRYNGELVGFYEECRDYLEAAERHQALESRTLRVELVLSNDGSAPATDIDIFIWAREGVRALEPDDKALKPPKMPRPPRPPGVPLPRRASDYGIPLGLLDPPRHPYLPILDPDRTDLAIHPTDYGAEVVVSLGRLKHKLQRRLPAFVLLLPEDAEPGSLSLDYAVNSADLIEDVEGQLEFVVRSGK